jgi:hypothetical protein
MIFSTMAWLACSFSTEAPPTAEQAAPPAAAELSAPVEATIARKRVPTRAGPEVEIQSVVVTLPDASVAAKINAALTPEPLAASASEPSDFSAWNARITWNEGGVLQVVYDTEYMGPYPSQHTLRSTFDVKSGDPINGAAAFGPDTTALRAKLDAALATRRAAHETQIRAELPDIAADDSLLTSLADAHFGDTELDDFELGANGIQFTHDYGTPHVALALLPPDPVTLDWATVGPMVNPAGPLAPIVRGR